EGAHEATWHTTSPMAADARSPAERLALVLCERGQTLAVAEGATGGLLAHLLTQVPGSSGWFRAGVVAYTDFAQQLILRVEAEQREPTPGLTFIAVSGPGSGRQPEAHSWEEWQLEAPDRATYKQNAAETAIETLLKIVEG